MVSIRLSTMKDFEAFYQIKCEPSNISAVLRRMHVRWFCRFG